MHPVSQQLDHLLSITITKNSLRDVKNTYHFEQQSLSILYKLLNETMVHLDPAAVYTSKHLEAISYFIHATHTLKKQISDHGCVEPDFIKKLILYWDRVLSFKNPE
jgi:hypothetical protein